MEAIASFGTSFQYDKYNGRVRSLLAALTLCLAASAQDCMCDPTNPATDANKGCALGSFAAGRNRPSGSRESGGVVFVKDNSPEKPHRWLALSTFTSPGFQTLTNLPADRRAELWREAIADATKQQGDRWGLAYNGIRGRSQCHVHIHMSQLVEGVEWGDFVELSDPAAIPEPGRLGLWLHPSGPGKFHVHTGEMYTETVLLQ